MQITRGRRENKQSKREYYTPSLIFALGVFLTLIGLALIAILQLNRYSNPMEIEVTFTIIGLAIPMALYGINSMHGFRRYKPATIAAFALTIIAVALFNIMYPEYWYYPQVIYVALIYSIGLVLFFSSAFAEAVMQLLERVPVIEKKVEKSYMEKKKLKKRIETELEIEETKLIEVEPDIDKTLDIVIVEPKVSDFEIGKALRDESYRGNVVRVKDSVPEAEELKKVRCSGMRVKKKGVKEVDEASKVLKMIEESKMKGKKGLVE